MSFRSTEKIRSPFLMEAKTDVSLYLKLHKLYDGFLYQNYPAVTQWALSKMIYTAPFDSIMSSCMNGTPRVPESLEEDSEIICGSQSKAL